MGLFAAALLLAGACGGDAPTAPVQQSPQGPQLNISEGEGPKIATDKVDYAPGETIVIDGWDWTAGETVRLKMALTDRETDAENPAYQPWDVTAATNGEISASWLVPDEAAGATLKLTADGQTSGAHAELILTDLIGSVALYADAGRTISQTAYPWGATVYPRLTSGGANNCYQIQWKDPSNAVQATETFGPGSTSYNPSGFPVPATGPSGTWSVVVAQNAGGDCAGPFTSPSDPILFDVARAVVIGAGTTGDDATAGDQCVAENTAPPGGCGATSASIWVQSQSANDVRTFIQFDLSSASPAALPAGVTITDAKVRLTVIGTPASQRTYEIQRAAAAWDEGSVTWAGQPTVTGTSANATVLTTLVAGAGGGDPQTWVKWNVATDVQAFVDGTTNNGWRIKDAAEDNGSQVRTRFASTENACTPGTTCKRVWPVLLLDYTAGPTKLAFITGPFTGQVGQCLGPMTVQSQDNSSSALAVTANTTVGLTSDNGGTGAGAFYSNNTCTTTVTSVQISSGNTNSSNFYYRATGRGDGTHELTADDTSPDRLTSATQTQTIDKAGTTLTYTGDLLVAVGSTLHLKAQLTSAFAPCIDNKRIIWGMDPDPVTLAPGFVFFTNSFTNTSGLATRDVATTGWQEGIFDARANFPGDADCEASKDDPAIAVLTPGNAATGGGFLAGNKVGGGRANFGFNVRPIEGSDPIAYKGQFLLIKHDGDPVFRCKGNVDTYGTVNGVNVAGGRCDFQVWNASLNGGLGGWEVPSGSGYTNRQFVIQFKDNGTGTKGKLAPPPDEFGFSINFVGSEPNPSFALAPINGGNIDTKTTSTTTSGGGKKR